MHICEFCEKIFETERSIAQHKIRCISNPNRRGYNNKPRQPHNWKCNQPKPRKKPSNQYIKARDLGSEYILKDETRLKYSVTSKNRQHTEETKKKLSTIRIQYLKQNPDKVPYVLNHSSRVSYPERYFDKIMKKTKLNYTKELQINLYSLDFAFIDLKVDLEIDGDQHYLDQKIVESDKRRTEYLNNQGWKVIRVRWSDYKKLTLKDRKKFIKDLINRIKNN